MDRKRCRTTAMEPTARTRPTVPVSVIRVLRELDILHRQRPLLWADALRQVFNTAVVQVEVLVGVPEARQRLLRLC